MLGDAISCLSCEGGAIFPQKLDRAIDDATSELLIYPKGSGERQVVEIELNMMIGYRAKVIARG